jgi:methyl-accepting chemotaxis protein
VAVLLSFVSSHRSGELAATTAQAVNEAFEALRDLSGKRTEISGQGIPPKAAIGFYSGVNAKFLNAISKMTGASEDAKVSTEITAYVAFLQSKERAGIERAVLNGTFSAGKFAEGAYQKYSSLVAEQDAYLATFFTIAKPAQVTFYQQHLNAAAVGATQRMRLIADSNDPSKIATIRAEDWFKQQTAKIDLLKEVEDKLSTDLAADGDKLQGEAITSLRISVALTSLALLASLWLGLIVASSIVNQVLTMRDWAKSAAEGNGDLTYHLSTDSRDELGELASWFNAFIEQLHDSISKVQQASVEVLRTAHSTREGLSDLALASREVAHTVQESAKGVEQVTHQLEESNVALHAVSAAVDNVARGSEQTASGTAMGSRRVEEVVASVQSVSRRSQAALEKASEVAKLGSLGQESLGKTRQAMAVIDAQSSDLADQLRDLVSLSGSIGNILKSIEEIADQTNMLALNAAIEAARAGEQGRGFAVVAEEVRRLAERTSTEVTAINDLVDGIATKADATTKAMATNRLAVDEGTKLSEQTADGLALILRSVEEIASTIGESVQSISVANSAASNTLQEIETIAALAEENSASSLEMRGSVKSVQNGLMQIAAISEEVSAGTEEMSATVEQQTAIIESLSEQGGALAHVAEELKELVGQFKVHPTEPVPVFKQPLRLAA